MKLIGGMDIRIRPWGVFLEDKSDVKTNKQARVLFIGKEFLNLSSNKNFLQPFDPIDTPKGSQKSANRSPRNPFEEPKTPIADSLEWTERVKEASD